MNTCLNCQKETKNRKYCCIDCSAEGQKSNPKICKLCNNIFPKHIVIDGKKINCQRRKYCFDCSPFGHHNSRTLDKPYNKNNPKIKECVQCGKLCIKTTRLCPTCYFNQRKERVTKKIYHIVGNSCWICDYDRTTKNLCFHHVDPTIKKFCLSNRETMLKWERVWKEMQKCILICHNCHGEVHANIVEESYVQKLFQDKWRHILENVTEP